MKITPTAPQSRPLLLLLLGLMAWSSLGCSETVRVKAEYRGLEGKPFAVLVSASHQILADYPNSVRRVTDAMVDRIRVELPHMHLLDSEKSIAFIDENLRWSLQPYSATAKKLDVDRLLLIELVEFQLHPPGNPHLYQATLTASIGVAQCDTDRPDDLDYTKTLKVMYPSPDGKGKTFGIPESATTAEDIALNLLEKFTIKTAWLFKDHREPAP